MINLDKRNQPKYLFKLNVAWVSFIVVFLTVFFGGLLLVVSIYGGGAIFYSISAGAFALFFIALAIFLLVDNKLHKRLIEQRTAELEKQFTEMPFEEAERILKEKEIITDTGFVVKDGKVVPFEDAWLSPDFKFISQISIDIVLYDEDSKEVVRYEFDNALYNFLQVKDTDLKDDPIINLLVNDKKEFAKYALQYSKVLSSKYIGSHGRHG